MVFRPNARVVALIAALVFALGGLLHAAAAAEMNGRMLTFPAEAPACDHGKAADDMSASSAACEAICTGPLFWLNTPASLGIAAANEAPAAAPDCLPGRTGPPDPYPPKPSS
jgi:hypothetical protein